MKGLLNGFIGFICLAFCFCSLSTTAEARNTGYSFSLSVDLGIVFNHDFYLRNTSDVTLRQVWLYFAITDSSGHEYEGERYFEEWKPDERKHISVSIQNTTSSPQKFIIRGTTNFIVDGEREELSSWLYRLIHGNSAIEWYLN